MTIDKKNEQISKIVALYIIQSSLHPKRIKEKIIVTHHLKLLVKVLLNPYYHERLEELQLTSSDANLMLKNLLADNWHTYKLTPCGYTAQPESEVTLLLCDIANTLGEITGEKPIHLLMPGVSTESIMDGVPSLEDMDLKKVLRTHIISDSGNYLYPVAALGSLACESDLDSQKIPNPYYDYNQVTESGETEGYIPAAALERMLNHSSDTQALLDAKARYQNLIKPSNLLGQLQMLIKTLRMNSKSGIGTEEQAGSRAYAGIISFNDYYQTLTNEQKSLIPQDLKDEIEFLLVLSGSKAQNDQGTQTLETCINIRQDKLASLTKQYESILINIGVDEQTQSELIKAAREDFVTLQNQIQANCNQGAYHGEDKLALSKKLVDTLNVRVRIRSRADLQDFLSLTACDIQLLLENNEALQNQIARKLETLDDLVLFSTQTSIEQMKAVLHVIVNKLPKLKGSELSVWLEMLDLKRFDVVLNVFQPFVIENSVHFKEVLCHLSVEKRDMVFNTYENRLAPLIQTTLDFKLILRYLSIAQRTKMYDAIKDKLPGMIQKAEDFANVCQFLTLEQQEVVYQETKMRIPDWVHSAEDLAEVLPFASEIQCKDILVALKDKLHDVIKTGEDVNVVFRFLDEVMRAQLFEVIIERFPELIKTANCFSTAFEFLNKEQSILAFEKIKSELPALIKKPSDIRRLIKRLNIEQCHMTLDAIRETLPKVILNLRDIRHVIWRLDADHLRLVLESLPPFCTQNAVNVGQVLQLLEDGSRLIFIDIIKQKLPNIINHCEDLGLLLKASGGPAGYLALLELVKDKLLNLLKSDMDVSFLLCYVPVKDRPALLEAILDLVPTIFNHQDNYGFDLILMSSFDLAQSPEVLTRIIPRLIQTAKSFKNSFMHLDKEHSKTLFEAMKDKLTGLIENAEDAGVVLSYLDDEIFTMVLEVIKHKLPTLIHQTSDVAFVLECISIQQMDAVLEAIKDQLPKLFKTVDEVNRLGLQDEKRALVIAALEKAQASELAANAPTFLPQKRHIDGNEPAKRQKRVGRREMAFLSHNAGLEQPRERKREESAAKRQRMSHS